MRARILFVGDIHLGRRPARLPEDLAEHDVSTVDLTPATVWRRTVRYAAEAGVDAVVLAGDVVEADNARFEAFGPLQEGVGYLVDRGIPVYAVSGNHDVTALPRLSDAIDGFRLLGRGGRWETVTVRRGEQPLVHLAGWSFPSATYPSSPLDLDSFPRQKTDELPLLGILHCDTLAADSPHAPVSRTALERSAMDGWLLGHVHKPSALSGPRPLGYLGSLVGLGPREPGLHGPWLLRAGPGEPIEVEQIPLAPLRWEVVEVDVATLESVDDVDSAANRSIERLHRSTARKRGEARAVGCRLRLTGSSPFHRALTRLSESGELQSLRFHHDGVLYFVHDVVDAAGPALDLETLAGDDHPPALLARRLLILEQGGEQADELVRRARRELMRVADERTWSQLEPLELADEAVRRQLIESGLRALEEMLDPLPGRPT